MARGTTIAEDVRVRRHVHLLLFSLSFACAAPRGAVLVAVTPMAYGPSVPAPELPAPARPPAWLPAFASPPLTALARLYPSAVFVRSVSRPPSPVPAPVPVHRRIPVPPAIAWSGLRVLFYVIGQQEHRGWVAIPLACHDGHDWLPQSSCLERLPPSPPLVFTDGRTIVAGERIADDFYGYQGLSVRPDRHFRSYAVYASEGAPTGVRDVDCVEDGGELAPFASNGFLRVPADDADLVARLAAGEDHPTGALRGDFDGDGRDDRIGVVDLEVREPGDSYARTEAWFVVLERRGASSVVETYVERDGHPSDSNGFFYASQSSCLDFDANGALEIVARYGGDSEAGYDVVIPYGHRLRHVGGLGFGD